MGAERTKNTVKNTISGLVFKIIGLIMPFIVRTVMIKKLGMDYLGLNSLFSSILQVLSLTELGFSSAIVFAMYKPIADGDSNRICIILKLLRNAYYIIGAVIFVIGLALIPAIPYLISGEHPNDVNLYILYGIYLFNTVISYFFFAYKGLLLTAHQKSSAENNIFSIVNLLMYTAQIVLLFVYPNYYVYIICLPICTLTINFVRLIVVNKMYPEYKCRGIIDPDLRKFVFRNIGSLIGHRLSYIVVFSLNNIIISMTSGLETLAVYNNYYYILNALIGIISVFHSSAAASIGNSIVVDSTEKNYNDFNKLTFINVWIVGWMSICLVCLYQHFMRIWVGDEFMFPFWVMILFVALFYLWKFKDILPTYKDAAGMWKADFWKPYTVIVISISLSTLLTRYIGVGGTLIAVILGVFVISFPWETHVFFKQYFEKSPKEYYLRMLIYTLIIIAVGAVTYLSCYFIPSQGFGWFALKCAICLVVPNSLFFLASFRTPEFKYVIGKIKNLFKRNKTDNTEND